MADEIRIVITGNSESAKKALKAVNKEFKENEKAANSTKSALSKLKGGYVAMAAVLTGAVAAGIKKSLSLASEFEEANNKFNVVFRGVRAEARAMRDELVRSYGTSTIEATKMLSGIQDFLVPMGFAREEASKMSGAITKMAADIGSFNDMPTAQVMEDIKSAVAGMSIPMRKYGADVSETALKQLALSKGMTISNGKLDRQQRMMLLLEKITRDTTDAQNDMINTQNSMANVMKRSKALGEDLVLLFGTELRKAFIDTNLEKTGENINKIRDNWNMVRKIVKGFILVLKVFALAAKNSFRSTIGGMIELTKVFIEGGKVMKKLFTEGPQAAKDQMLASFDTIKNNALNFVTSMVDDYKEIGLAFKDLVTGEEELHEDAIDKMIDNEEKFTGSQKNELKKRKKQLTEAQKYAKIMAQTTADFKKSMLDAGVNAVVDAAADEKATIGSVAAAFITATARAMSEVLTIRAIAAFAIGNIAGGVTMTAAAAAVRLLGTKVAAGIRGDVTKAADGMTTDEPMLAVGQRTGRQFLIGEAGPENIRTTVTPEGRDAGPGGDIIIQGDLIVQANNADELVQDLKNKLGIQANRR